MTTVHILNQTNVIEQPKETFMDKLDRWFSVIDYPEALYRVSNIPKPGKSIWNISTPEK